MHLQKIRFKVIALVALLFMTAQCLAADVPSIQDILKYTNEYRKSKGKPALVLNDTASALASQHSKNMAKGKSAFGHTGFKERVEALKSDGRNVSSSAENVAFGYMTAREVVDGWIKSRTHRINMLGKFTDIGIGVATSKDGRIYFTQLFFKR
jgi:uncharacterized protein YkwD